MIPDHLIDRAAQAIVTGMGSKSLLADMHPEDAAYARAEALAALETVAADIWDQGYRAGFSDGPFICACNAWNEGECACGNYGNGETPEPNPYRASETA